MPALFKSWLLSLFFLTLISAKDLLFLTTMADEELTQSVALGFTSDVVTEAQWLAMTISDFMAYRAIIIPGPPCGSEANLDILDTTKSIWSPAITGNIIILGICISTETLNTLAGHC
jgi:anthranilate/para-aminobenzoate synthase component II